MFLFVLLANFEEWGRAWACLDQTADMKRISQNNFIFRTLCLTAGLSEAFTRPGGLPSRGRFEDLLREVANDLKGLSGRMQGPIEVGRCANRETNKCCAGSSWDCQAPGSTCSCDQVNRKALLNSWLICYLAKALVDNFKMTQSLKQNYFFVIKLQFLPVNKRI